MQLSFWPLLEAPKAPEVQKKSPNTDFKVGLGSRQTEVCRECVRSEQSDGMYGNHFGKCECCK